MKKQLTEFSWIWVVPGKTLAALSVAAVSSLFSVNTGWADSVYNYIGFGIQDHTLYGFTDYETRVVLSNSILTANAHGNHLATDALNNRLLYTKGLGDGNITALYAWDFDLGGEVLLYSGLNVVGYSSGGASFWNGSYYLYDDEPSGSPSAVGIVKITFNPDGSVDTISKPFGNINPAGGLGDVAIDPSGIMYILSTNGELRSIDLTIETTTPTFTLIGDTGLNGGGQLFFDPVGNLLVRSGTNWVIVDPLTAEPVGTINGGASATYADLSSAALNPIPEPGSVLLFSMGACLVLFMRRRAHY
jgi:hypothetical protein